MVAKTSNRGSKPGERRGGRKKGTPNKKTCEFKEKLGSFDTIAEMVELFYQTEKEEVKLAICKEFLKYEYPQRKALDLDVATIELPEINIAGI